MYGENGALLRAELSVLLQQHRIQHRIGSVRTSTTPDVTTASDREQIGKQILRYRQSALVWCGQAARWVAPHAGSNVPTGVANPFRLPAIEHGGLAALRNALDQALRASTTSLPNLDELTTSHDLPLVDHWRQVARAAAMGEHDFDASRGHGPLDQNQTHTLIGDIAATVRALVVLDQRYALTPGWEKLHRGDRLGWAALACALDASMEPPDFAIEMRGWRPTTKLITGPAEPGLLGVLQAEHNLVIRMRTFPDVMNLRLIVDSQRILSGGLAGFADKTDPQLHQQWCTRERTYVDLQHELRNIGGQVGKGGLAVAEGANAVSRFAKLHPDVDVDPRVLHAFTTLFTRLDARIAEVIETGLRHRGYLTRVLLPRVVENSGELTAPQRARYVPLADGTPSPLLDLVRGRLCQPGEAQVHPREATRSRAELYAAIVHQPARRATRDSPSL
jgi:hypothetical protein